MPIDVACLVFCLIYAAFGYFSGAMLQIVKLAAIILGYIAAKWAAPIAIIPLSEKFRIPPEMLDIVAVTILWGVFYLLLGWVGNLTVKTIKKASETLTSYDKLFGLLLGFLKGAVIVVLLILLFGLIKEHVFKIRPQAYAIYHESIAVRLVERIPLGKNHLPLELKQVVMLMEALTDKEKASKLLEDPVIKDVIKSESFQEAMKDKKLQLKIKSGQVGDVMDHPKVRALLDDPKMLNLIHNIGGRPSKSEKQLAEPKPDR